MSGQKYVDHDDAPDTVKGVRFEAARRALDFEDRRFDLAERDAPSREQVAAQEAYHAAERHWLDMQDDRKAKRHAAAQRWRNSEVARLGWKGYIKAEVARMLAPRAAVRAAEIGK